MVSVDLDTQSKVISFQLGSSLFGIDILDIQQIIRATKATRLFKAAPFIEGIIDLRGEVIPLIDLGKRLDMAGAELSDEARIIVIELNERRIGLLVDSVSEILTLTNNQRASAPSDVAGIKTEFIQEISKTKDGLLIVLDLEKVLYPEGSPSLHRPESRSKVGGEIPQTKSTRPPEEARPQMKAEEAEETQSKLGKTPSLRSFLSPRLREKLEGREAEKTPPVRDEPKDSPAQDVAETVKSDIPSEGEELDATLSQETLAMSWDESVVPPDEDKPPEIGADNIRAEKPLLDVGWEESVVAPVEEKDQEVSANEISWEEAAILPSEGAHEIEWEGSFPVSIEAKALEVGWEEPSLELEWEEAAIPPSEGAGKIEWEELIPEPVESAALEVGWEEVAILPSEGASEIEWEESIPVSIEAKALEVGWEEPSLELEWEKK